MEEAHVQTLTAHEALDEARRRIAEARTAIDPPTEAPRRVFSARGALQLGASSLLGSAERQRSDPATLPRGGAGPSGARPRGQEGPLEEFERIASDYPVFRIQGDEV